MMDRPILSEKAKETKEYGKNPILPTSGSLMLREVSSYLKTEEKVRGIDLRKDVQKWRAHLTINGQRIYLGMFDTKEEAIRARINAEAIYGRPHKGVRLDVSRIFLDREIAFVELFSKRIPDTWAIIDIDDVPKVMNIRWLNNKGYAETAKNVYIQRLVLDAIGNPLDIDHINHDPLNNRKNNLRLCTRSHNILNQRPGIRSKTGVLGVNYDKKRKHWIANITLSGHRHYLGQFSTMDEAVQARREAEKNLGVGV
jgi:hypothetical protein